MSTQADTVETASEVVAKASTSTSLSVLSPLEKVKAGLIQLATESESFDVTTTVGEKAARAFRAKCVSLRTAVDEAYETVNRPLLQTQRDARALRDEVKEQVKRLEEPVDQMIKAEEARKEVERIRKAEAEASRIATLNERVDSIKAIAVRAVGKPSDEIAQKIQLIAGMHISEAYQELKPAAEQAQTATLATLRELYAAAIVQEDAARLVAEQRAELARRQAEQAEADRIQRERIAEEQRAQQARLDAERAALERDQREARERQEQIEREARLRREEEDRRAAAAREQADREAHERRAAEEQRLAEERAQLRREQEERDRRARDEEETLIASIRKQANRVEGDNSGYVKKAMNAFEVVARDWENDPRPGVATAIAEGRALLAAMLEGAQKREEREAAEAEEQRQAEIRAEQRRREEAAAIADKRVRDVAPQLLAALRLLVSLVRRMGTGIQNELPTTPEIHVAVDGADAVIALAISCDAQAVKEAPAKKRAAKSAVKG